MQRWWKIGGFLILLVTNIKLAASVESLMKAAVWRLCPQENELIACPLHLRHSFPLRTAFWFSFYWCRFWTRDKLASLKDKSGKLSKKRLCLCHLHLLTLPHFACCKAEEASVGVLWRRWKGALRCWEVASWGHSSPTVGIISWDEVKISPASSRKWRQYERRNLQTYSHLQTYRRTSQNLPLQLTFQNLWSRVAAGMKR